MHCRKEVSDKWQYGVMAVHSATSSVATAAPVQETSERQQIQSDSHLDAPWVAIVWNDPVNLMSYVTYVLRKLFGYDHTKANKLMLDVHQKGHAVVASGARERMEYDVSQLHSYGLWATLRRDS